MQNSELTRVAERLGVQLARRQPLEQPLDLSGRGNHEDAVAATQAGFDKGEGRLDERIVIAVELCEVAPQRGFEQ